jgi:Zn-dependent protease
VAAPTLTIAGIPVRVGGSFLLMAALLAYLRAGTAAMMLAWVLVVFGSVLVHELGHAFAARSYGLAPHITLHAVGGTTTYAAPQPFGGGRHAVISLAGPFAGFLVGFAALAWWRTAPGDGLVEQLQRDLIWVNLGWGVLNLVPILPLDGGNVLRALAGERVARLASLAMAAGLVVVAARYRQAPAAVLLGWLAVMNLGPLVNLARRRQDAPLLPKLTEAQAAYARGDAREAMRLAREVLDRAKARETQWQAAMVLSWAALAAADRVALTEALGRFPVQPPAALRGASLLLGGRMDEAVSVLEEAWQGDPGPLTGAHLAHALAASGRVADALRFLDDEAKHLDVDAWGAVEKALYDAGRFGEAGLVGDRGFERHGEPTLAYNAACSYARAGAPDAAMASLRKAVDAGWRELAHLDADEDLASLRGRPDYAELRARCL